MNKEERLEAKELPAKYRPMGAWGYFWFTILYCIPLIGWICMVVTAIASRNVARRSYARSFFISCVIIMILTIAFLITGVCMGGVDVLINMIMDAMPKIA